MCGRMVEMRCEMFNWITTVAARIQNSFIFNPKINFICKRMAVFFQNSGVLKSSIVVLHQFRLLLGVMNFFNIIWQVIYVDFSLLHFWLYSSTEDLVIPSHKLDFHSQYRDPKTSIVIKWTIPLLRKVVENCFMD